MVKFKPNLIVRGLMLLALVTLNSAAATVQSDILALTGGAPTKIVFCRGGDDGVSIKAILLGTSVPFYMQGLKM